MQDDPQISAKHSRRQMLLATAAAGISSLIIDKACAAAADPQSQPAAKPYYYVDGYHGGIDGHMPPSSLRNVLDGLDHSAGWKVSFEIEPYSWAAFAKTDPESIKRLAHHLEDKTPAARIELVSGAYGQCYAWNISGESNIRHLIYGNRAIQAVFPDVRVDTYAVQEPCWTSCLPQLLTSLGYKRAVLKNSTCWGGYHGPTIDADLIHWTGPDGTSIPTVPRYASEGLIGPATIESSQPGATFIDRCTKAGIANPAGTILQDMGWPGRPWRLGIAPQIANTMRHVTWREYVDTIASPPTQKWEASQEDLRVGLAWGASIVQRITQNVRRAENMIIQAEKMASLAGFLHGAEYPTAVLDKSWIDLLFCQHHDVWIVPYNRRPGGSWASEAELRQERIAKSCRDVVATAAGSDPNSATQPSSGPRSIRIWNTTGFPRKEPIAINVSADSGHWKITSIEGEASPTQALPDKSGNRIVFATVEAPPMGFATYHLNPASENTASSAPRSDAARTETDGTTILENDQYTLKLDPVHGGRISSLVHRASGKEFVDTTTPRSFHEFRGYFGKEERFLSSTDAPATIAIEESGPLRDAVRIDGHIGPHPFQSHISLSSGSPRIDVRTTFDFPLDAPPFGRSNQPPAFRVGEPWPRGKDSTRSDRRPMYDSSYKLQALFPTALKSPVLDKNAPFAVCRSRLKDTTFNSWATLQHNVILNWVDLAEADGSAGLAVMSDHTTAYSFKPGEPLGLICCYSGLGTWFDYALGRKPDISYALIPHAGDWEKAQLWRELSEWSEPLIATDVSMPASEQRWSLAEVANPNVQITSLHQDKDDSLLRVFNASVASATTAIQFAPIIKKVALLELDGRLISELSIKTTNPAKPQVELSMPRFAVRTLRLSRA